MKYEIANFLFGWMTRPILMWSGWDFIKVGCWIYLICWSVTTLKENHKNIKYKKEYYKLKKRREW